MITPWDELTPEQQEPYMILAEEILTDLLWCERDWSAWSAGTMTEHDFTDASEEAGDEAKAIYEFVQTKGLKLILE